MLCIDIESPIEARPFRNFQALLFPSGTTGPVHPWALFHKRNVSVKCKCETRGFVVAMATALPTPIDTQLPWQRRIRAFYTYILHLHFFYETGPWRRTELRYGFYPHCEVQFVHQYPIQLSTSAAYMTRLAVALSASAVRDLTWSSSVRRRLTLAVAAV